jgi:hypothetical protein
MDGDWQVVPKQNTAQGNHHGKGSKSKAKDGPKESPGSGQRVSRQQGGGDTAHANAKWGDRRRRPEDGPAKHANYVAPPAYQADTEEGTEEEFHKKRNPWYAEGTNIPELKHFSGSIAKSSNMNRVNHAVPLSYGGATCVPQEYYCDFCSKYSGIASAFVVCHAATEKVPPHTISAKVKELKHQVWELTGFADAGFEPEAKTLFHNLGLSETCVSCCYECYGEKFVEPESARSRTYYVNYGD